MKNDAQRSNLSFNVTKRLILQCLRENHPNKMGVGEITKYLKKDVPKIHRTTITSNCKDLSAEGLIYKENKQAKYGLTSIAFNEPILYRRMYKTRILKKIWEIKPPLSYINSDETVLKLNIRNITKFLKYNIKNSRYDYSDDEIELFKFVTKIGSIITWLFLQATQPLDNLEISKSEKNRKLLTNITNKEKDESTERWIRQIIDPLEIFREFCKLKIVKRGQAIWKPNSNLSMYEMNDENFDKLEKLFEKVFPLVYEKIQQHADRQYQEVKASVLWDQRYTASERKKIREDKNHTITRRSIKTNEK